MGSDIRAKNLDKISLTDYKKYYKSVKLAIDTASYTTCKSILLYNMFKVTSVSFDESEVAYKMLTPKAFLSSLATTSNLGIVRFGTESEVKNKISGVAISNNYGHLLIENDLVTITNADKSFFLAYQKDCNTNINTLKYVRRGNVVNINGQILITPTATVNTFALYFQNFNLPIIPSVGNAFSVDSAGNFSNLLGVRCFAKDGYLVALEFDSYKLNYSTSSNYYVTFQISYIYKE